MESITKKCFVCQIETTKENLELNQEVNLPICKNCKGTAKEKEKTAELLDSLADGLVCGCI
jgi:NMD protein affecting ribosome stability and mRNA decay